MDNPLTSKKDLLLFKKNVRQAFNIEEWNLILKNHLIMKL